MTFLSGGIAGKYGDTLSKRAITATLNTTWTKYAIDLRGGDLSRVVGAFGWTANRSDNPAGARFYLDDIRIDKTILPPPKPQPCVVPPAGTPPGTLYILDGNLLCSRLSPVGKYDFGVDTSGHRRDWLKTTSDALKMSYPSGQKWGAVFLTVGAPAPPGSRLGQDLAQCRTLQVDLRSDSSRAGLSIGMKDMYQADDGLEAKIRVKPTRTWKTYSFGLTSLTGVDLSAVYVVIEFVFEAKDPPQVVHFRNVRLLCT